MFDELRQLKECVFKVSIIIILALYSAMTFAKVDTHDLRVSFERFYLMDSSYLKSIENEIYFAAPSMLQKWGIINKNASASYNSVTNTIVLRGDLYKQVGLGWGAIKSVSDFQNGVWPLTDVGGFLFEMETIFHEYAHADFDVFLEENTESEIHRILLQELPIWVDRYFNNVNPKVLVSEIFGYTAANVLLTIRHYIEAVLRVHGVYYEIERCFNKKSLKKIRSKLGLDLKFEDVRYKKLKQSDNNALAMFPDFVFVDGVDFNISNVPEEFKTAIVDYFIKQYSLPSTYVEIVERLNNSAYYLMKLRSCYSNLD